MSNEESADAILDAMEKENNPEEFSGGLEILFKLIHNIILNPEDPKFRNVKTSNNTIKTKILNLKHVDSLLKQLGYILDGDVYVLKDQFISEFLEGAPAVDYRRRLASAKLESKEAYEKEKYLLKEYRAQQREKIYKEQQAQRLIKQCENDVAERKNMKIDESKSKKLKFGAKASTWKDIGVDLCKKPGGGCGCE